MSKTIEEAERRVYSELELRQIINDFRIEFMSKPLASRLTPEEKERVRKEYANTYPNDIDCGVENMLIQGVLERIFGADFFKEGE